MLPVLTPKLFAETPLAAGNAGGCAGGHHSHRGAGGAGHHRGGAGVRGSQGAPEDEEQQSLVGREARGSSTPDDGGVECGGDLSAQPRPRHHGRRCRCPHHARLRLRYPLYYFVPTRHYDVSLACETKTCPRLAQKPARGYTLSSGPHLLGLFHDSLA